MLSLAEPASPQAEVEAGYRKAGKAAELMYTDGYFAIRSGNFVGVNPKGELIDLTSEKKHFQEFMDVAHKVTTSFKIVSFRLPDEKHAICEVQQSLSIKLLEPGKDRPITIVLESDSIDSWVKSPRGWRQASSKVKRQHLRRSDV